MRKAIIPSRVQWRHLDDVAAQNDSGRLAVTCGKGSTTSTMVSNGWVRFVQSREPRILPRSGGRIDSSFASGWEITDAGRAALARARTAHLSDRPRSTAAQKLGPLRCIVAEGANEHGVATETLECGSATLPILPRRKQRGPMRLNLRKINQLIREAWSRGQKEARRGAGKSSCYSWSYQVACDFFPDIDPQDAARIAKGQARLHWDAEKREIVIVSTAADEPVSLPFEQRQSEDRLQESGPRGSVTYVDLLHETIDKEKP